MVEHSEESPYGVSSGRSHLGVLLGLGGGLVVAFWLLLTGTAHAAEVGAEGPRGPVTHALDHLPTAAHHGAVRHEARTKVRHEVHRVTTFVKATHDTATDAVHKAASTSPKQVVEHVTQQAEQTTGVSIPALTDKSAPRARHASARGAEHRALPHTAPRTTEHTSHLCSSGGIVAHAPSSIDLPQLPHQEQGPPAPAGQDRDTAGSPGIGGALLEQAPLIRVSAAAQRGLDVRRTSLLEPAYPPGSSPD